MREDGVLLRLLESFDELLAPAVVRIDRLEDLADPVATPDDIVDWLCLWLGWDFSPSWPSVECKRALLAESGLLLAARGTARGLEAVVRVLGGSSVSEVTVEEPGCVWTSLDEGPLPAAGPCHVQVTVRGDLQAWTSTARAELERLLAWDVPADVTLLVRLVPP